MKHGADGNMSQIHEWKTEEWLDSAKNLVEWVNSTPLHSKVLMLVRHSHREEIQDHSVQLSTELTPLGCRMSNEMGKRLPKNRATRIFFSFVSRCYQTAEELSKGMKESSVEIKEFDALTILTAPEINDLDVWKELQPDGRNITDFVNSWADGEFGDMIEPFEEYKGRLLDDLVERLVSDKPGSLHIHITHDLALMATKRILLRRAVNVEDREAYLGGLGIIVDEGRIRVFTGNKNRESPYNT